MGTSGFELYLKVFYKYLMSEGLILFLFKKNYQLLQSDLKRKKKREL